MATTKKWVQPDNKKKLKAPRQDNSLPETTLIDESSKVRGRTTPRRKSALYDARRED